MEEQSLVLRDYLVSLRKRKKIVFTIFLTLMCVFALMAYLLPSSYKSSATILIEQQEIPRELVMSTVTSYAAERIQAIEAQINRVIEDDFSITEEFVTREEAEIEFDLKRLPDAVGESIRIIKMGDYDSVPCIGNHVKNTGQIGGVKLISSSFEDNILRIRFKLIN